MYALIAILAPSILGVKIIDYLNKGLSFKNTIYYFTILLLFSSILNSVIAYSLLNIDDKLFNNLNSSLVLFEEYSLISIFINILLALIVIVVQKNASFTLEVKDVKKSKKNEVKTKRRIKKDRKNNTKISKKNKNK